MCIPYQGHRKGLIYMSFLPDGGVSVGLSDKTVRVLPKLRVGGGSLDAEDELLDLQLECGLKELRNPHYSLHGAFFHLKSSKEAVLYKGLVWTKPFPGEEVSPWIRLRTNPISQLKGYSGTMNGNPAEILLLQEPLDDCSVEFHFDFVAHESDIIADGKRVTRTFAWGDFFLRVTALQSPPTASTLGSFVMG